MDECFTWRAGHSDRQIIDDTWQFLLPLFFISIITSKTQVFRVWQILSAVPSYSYFCPLPEGGLTTEALKNLD